MNAADNHANQFYKHTVLLKCT